MGFLDFFKSKNVENKGTFEDVEIVGESFQKDSFKVIRDKLGKTSDSEASVSVELRNEPNNPHASEGKAVAAFVLGQKVGYVSSYTAIHVFELLEKQKGQKTLPGKIYFGDMRENPPKNSVSIKITVQTKSVEETKKLDDKYQRDQELRHAREVERDKFLTDPDWSKHALTAGDSVTFTGFEQWDDLPKLAEAIIGPNSKGGINLLVLHPSKVSDSAKLRDWLAKKKPAADLSTFLENNPEFAAYYNESTEVFDIPRKITGKKELYVPPVTTRVFESDTNVAARAQRMPSDLVLLPEQTLAIYPTFTIYGHLNWRLSDLKLFRQDIDGLFAEVQGRKGDSILVRGKLVEVLRDGETRLEFQFRGSPIGFVPKNETQALIRDGRSWKANAALGLIGWDHKNNLKGDHDCGLTELDFRK